MASMSGNSLAPNSVPTNPDTPISIKVTIEGSNRKFKLPLRELSAAVFVAKLRSILLIPSDQKLVLERFSDSSGTFVVLDPNNPATYKQLYRAAKAKLKLRLRAQILPMNQPSQRKPDPNKAEVNTPNPHPPMSQGSQSALPSNPTQTQLHQAPSSSSIGAEKMNGTNSSDLCSAREKYYDQLARISRERSMGMRMKEAPTPQLVATSWQVCCNRCDKPVLDAHYHCSICDGGDYDLCEACVTAGSVCRGDGHWLIKRSIKNGNVISSTTEKVAPKSKIQELGGKEMPGSFNNEVKAADFPQEPRRTCNACVRVLPEKLLVTCTNCEDFDLCVPCHLESKHGHHPGHTLERVSPGVTLSEKGQALCVPGRGQRHQAICDGCQKGIIGVRHKCLDCPDFDFCGKCIEGGRGSHGHRFVPLYEPLAAPAPARSRHHGIYCDGPLCKDKRHRGYITGVRYKCAICYDTDFCASCEAHPDNHHNETHPLIKFKTMIRDVSVSTIAESANGDKLHQLGEVVSAVESSNSESAAILPPYTPGDQRSVKVEVSSPEGKPVDNDMPCSPIPGMRSMNAAELEAHFLRDTVQDGTQFPAGKLFFQTWTLQNPGPYAWPAGCSVRHVGGDNMLNIDSNRPTSHVDLSGAQESNRSLREVLPGDSANFHIAMRAPARTGKHISYWRLKAPDGTPFGHRLWCDIQVTAKAEPSPPVQEPSTPQRQFSIRTRLRELSSRQSPPAVPRATSADTSAPSCTNDGSGRNETENCTDPPSIDARAALDKQDESQKRHNQSLNHMLLLQQHMQAAELKRVENKPAPMPVSPPKQNLALRDYELQLCLLEQQNKKRLLMARQGQLQTVENAVPSTMRPSVSQTPSVEPVADAAKTTQVSEQNLQHEGKAALEGSAMVFPTLEKESPASSTHEDASSKAAALASYEKAPLNSQGSGESGAAQQPPSTAVTEATSETESNQADETKDVDSIDFSDNEDDGFLTDEEYDILDASDEEIINGGAALKA